MLFSSESAADEDVDLGGVAGEVHGGLAGGVGAADDVDGLAGAGLASCLAAP